MPPREKERDIGWNHGSMIENNRFKSRCKWCGHIMNSGGVTRLKQHIAGGFPNTQDCKECPKQVKMAMKEHLRNKKKDKRKVKQNEESILSQLKQVDGETECFNIDDEDDNSVPHTSISALEKKELERAMRISRQEVEDLEERTLRGIGGSGSKHGTQESFVHKRKTSITTSLKDPYLYRSEVAKQRRLEDSWTGSAARSLGKCISKFFHYNHIPANVANTIYYKNMVSQIQKLGKGVKPPTAREISGVYLDVEMEELQDYIKDLKKEWETYGVTIMCDGWTGPTRLSIINFMVYCFGKTIFHASVDSSNFVKDHQYLYKLMDKIVEEIGEQYIIQIVTDNDSAFKKAATLLMEKRKHLYWTPCAAHCIDLMLKEIGKKKFMQSVMEKAKMITNYIYNHNWVLTLMREHTGGELVRPGITRFATNWIALSSLYKHKQGLKSMFTSEKWSNYHLSSKPTAKYVEDLVCSNQFWDSVHEAVKILEPIVKVLKMVDGDKTPTMGYIYEAMRLTKLAVQEATPRSYKQYCDIIEDRWNRQLLHDLHAAAHYLNPKYQYTQNIGTNEELLRSLQKVIERLEPNMEKALQAVFEAKMFREKLGTFGSAMAAQSWNKSEPADWWVTYGIDAPHLRKIAIRILSQTSSSSGCERNWSTFSLIHTKQRNRLSYEKLTKLVFVHYNMRLKLKHMSLDVKKGEEYFDPIDLTNIFDEEDPLMSWIAKMEDLSLDEPGDGLHRPSNFLASEMNIDVDKWVEEQQKTHPNSSEGLFQDVNSEGSTEYPDVGNFRDSYKGIYFTEEQNFDHVTQDSDHGAREKD